MPVFSSRVVSTSTTTSSFHGTSLTDQSDVLTPGQCLTLPASLRSLRLSVSTAVCTDSCSLVSLNQLGQFVHSSVQLPDEVTRGERLTKQLDVSLQSMLSYETCISFVLSVDRDHFSDESSAPLSCWITDLESLDCLCFIDIPESHHGQSLYLFSISLESGRWLLRVVGEPIREKVAEKFGKRIDIQEMQRRYEADIEGLKRQISTLESVVRSGRSQIDASEDSLNQVQTAWLDLRDALSNAESALLTNPTKNVILQLRQENASLSAEASRLRVQQATASSSGVQDAAILSLLTVHILFKSFHHAAAQEIRSETGLHNLEVPRTFQSSPELMLFLSAVIKTVKEQQTAQHQMRLSLTQSDETSLSLSNALSRAKHAEKLLEERQFNYEITTQRLQDQIKKHSDELGVVQDELCLLQTDYQRLLRQRSAAGANDQKAQEQVKRLEKLLDSMTEERDAANWQLMQIKVEKGGYSETLRQMTEHANLIETTTDTQVRALSVRFKAMAAELERVSLDYSSLQAQHTNCQHHISGLTQLLRRSRASSLPPSHVNDSLPGPTPTSFVSPKSANGTTVGEANGREGELSLMRELQTALERNLDLERQNTLLNDRLDSIVFANAAASSPRAISTPRSLVAQTPLTNTVSLPFPSTTNTFAQKTNEVFVPGRRPISPVVVPGMSGFDSIQGVVVGERQLSSLDITHIPGPVRFVQ